MRVSVWGIVTIVGVAYGLTACASTKRHGAKTDAGTAGGAGSNGGSGQGGGGASGESGSETQLVPTPSGMRKLDRSEYFASVQDTLGSTLQPLLEPDVSVDSFDNLTEGASMTPHAYEGYEQAARLLAADVFASPTFRARVVSCGVADDAGCIAKMLGMLGRRLFRRPLLDAEISAYQKVYAAARHRGSEHEPALEQVLVALLASAQFLYRMELVDGTDSVAVDGALPLAPFALATRLSYLLWNSTPDDTLLSRADEGALDSEAGLLAEFRRLWDDTPRRQRFVENFAGQWLQARRLPGHAVAPALFPAWSPAVAGAAQREVGLYFEQFVGGELPWSEFLTNRNHFVDDALAPIYGLSGAADPLRPVRIENQSRAGYLGLVGFLALSSLDRRTSPTERGNTIYEQLLCTPLPPPPAGAREQGMDRLPPQATWRERVLDISNDPDCAECHRRIDAPGLALEGFDAIGRYRTSYADGAPVDPSIAWNDDALFDAPVMLRGPEDLSATLTSLPAFQTCVVRKLYMYATGHVPDAVDRENIAGLASQWQTGPLTLRELLQNLVLSKPFRLRSSGGRP